MSMPKLTRRTLLRRFLGSLLTVLGLGSGGYYYANRIEPALLEINSFIMEHPRIPKSFEELRIVQFSDTHLGFHYDIIQFEKLVQKINNLRPDMIFFTGDLLDEPNKFDAINQVVLLLQQLEAPLGKYCIFGNHDHGGYGSDIYKNIMETANFTVLLNESIQLERDGSSISLIGIDDRMLGRPNFELAQEKVPEDHFKILLSHAPDVADEASNHKIHWQLSGHSHGGQVKIPFLGALVIPPFAKKYPEGYYSIGENSPLHLYVNRGIGTTRLPFRFLAKPEITVFTLQTAVNE
jgi:uncharacterized protein